MEVVAESHQHFLTCLALDATSGVLYALCAASGEVLRCDVEGQNFIPVGKTSLSPVSFAFVTEGQEERWVFACPTQTALLTASPPVSPDESRLEEGTEEPPLIQLAPYLASPGAPSFIAPTALCVSPLDKEVVFTDAGSEGDASLFRPRGAVYRTVHHRTAIVAIEPTGLAQPSSVAAGRDGCVFVTEMCANRLLRYVPRGGGLQYSGAVYARFQGSMGPSAVVVHPCTGHLFVALYEAAEVGGPYVVEDDAAPSAVPPPLPGRVVELSLSGAEVCTYQLPDTQLRALAFDVRGDNLFVVSSDSSTCWSTLYRISLTDS